MFIIKLCRIIGVLLISTCTMYGMEKYSSLFMLYDCNKAIMNRVDWHRTFINEVITLLYKSSDYKNEDVLVATFDDDNENILMYRYNIDKDDISLELNILPIERMVSLSVGEVLYSYDPEVFLDYFSHFFAAKNKKFYTFDIKPIR